MGRKEVLEARNPGADFGATVESFFDGPDLAQARTSVIMVERILFSVLRIELEKLSNPANVAETTRLFRHFFDPLTGEAERAEFVTNLQRRPPTVTLGYPRTTIDPPIVSVVLGEESENDSGYLADYVGETLPDESGPYSEYVGAHFQQTYNIFCYAEHPVVCSYLYHFIKLILIAAKPFMLKAGIVDPHVSGGELQPDEGYIPENMFVRVVRLSCQSLSSVPLLRLDSSGYRITGVFMNDVVVDGVRGGVTPTEGEEGEEGDEDE